MRRLIRTNDAAVQAIVHVALVRRGALVAIELDVRDEPLTPLAIACRVRLGQILAQPHGHGRPCARQGHRVVGPGASVICRFLDDTPTVLRGCELRRQEHHDRHAR